MPQRFMKSCTIITNSGLSRLTLCFGPTVSARRSIIIRRSIDWLKRDSNTTQYYAGEASTWTKIINRTHLRRLPCEAPVSEWQLDAWPPSSRPQEWPGKLRILGVSVGKNERHATHSRVHLERITVVPAAAGPRLS